MARPHCPLCHDNLSVAPVRAVYQCHLQEQKGDNDAEPSTSPFQPPAQFAPPGRYAIGATVAGMCIWVASGFTFLCLAMSICLGIFLEFIAYLDSIDARAERRQALRRWYAAHYCGTHDVVFLRGDPVLYPPAAFAQQMQAGVDQPASIVTEPRAASTIT